MKRVAWALLLLGCAHKPPPPPPKPAAQSKLYDDLGSYHRAISSKSPEAQRYFDQGLRLSYAFNHEEAERAFENAAHADPGCAICFWGAALVLGPNINQSADGARGKKALALLSQAKPAPDTPLVEKAMIAALKYRYADPPPADEKAQAALDKAYADAMRAIARQFPNDDDVQVLFAESAMDLRPWKLWTRDGKPEPGTDEIIATLEKVLARNPKHPGANHYLIHAVEASPHPERATAAADRVAALMPGAGHIVHMPSHIYERLGRYNDAAEANRKAIAADKKYLGTVRDPGMYAMYVAHNYQFLWQAAMMAGRANEALEATREMLKLVPAEMWQQMPEVSYLLAAPSLALVRFGRWKEALVEKAPPNLPLASLMHHYARARAQAGLGKLAEAEQEIAAAQKAADALPKNAKAGLAPASTFAEIALSLARGDVACRRHKAPAGLQLLRAAVAAADTLPYDEPPDWYYPPRQTLGAWLLLAKKAALAEKVFAEDLARNPGNGWSLTGLRNALLAQKKKTADVDTRLASAWSSADTRPPSSDF
jgi:tetratricopeptide (TPR) repeat protein